MDKLLSHLASSDFCVKWRAVGLLATLLTSGCSEQRRVEPPKTAAEMVAAHQGREILAAMAKRYRELSAYACRIVARTEDVHSGRSSFVETGSSQVEFRRGDRLRVWGRFPSLNAPGPDYEMICDQEGCRWRYSNRHDGQWVKLDSTVRAVRALIVTSRESVLLCSLLCDLRWPTKHPDYLVGTVEESMGPTVSLVRWEGEQDNRICVLKAMCGELVVEMRIRHRDSVLLAVKELLPASAGKGSRLVLRPPPDSALVGTYEFHDITYR